MASNCFVFVCRTILIANNVSLMSKEVAPLFSADDVAKIKKFAKDKKQVGVVHFNSSLLIGSSDGQCSAGSSYLI